jgi:hypothetical protein
LRPVDGRQPVRQFPLSLLSMPGAVKGNVIPIIHAGRYQQDAYFGLGIRPAIAHYAFAGV